MHFPVYRQLDATDCGPTCLRMVARHYGRSIPLELLRDRCAITRAGVSLLGISTAAESIGFRTLAARVSFAILRTEAPLPCIAHWQQNHFVVIVAVGRNRVRVADPAHGMLSYSRDEFLAGWASAGNQEGVVLLLEPTPAFHHDELEAPKRRSGMAFMLSYLWRYKRHLAQLVLGVVFGSLLTLIFPFLTQAIVDVGIANQDIGFVYTVLLAQIMLFVSQTSVEFIQSWILLHVGARVNISIVSDFLTKLMALPLSFFDTRTVGDLLQRVGDHQRIEHFLSSSTLGILFTFVNFVIFSIVLAVYSPVILGVFCGGTLLAACWLALFLGRRSALDYKRFARRAETQGKLIQLINGMPELKLTNSERQKRWEWEHLQAALFKLNMKGLSLSQYQQAGMLFLLKAKDIIITFIAAKEVIDGRMTLGMMLAVQYIIGQLSGPIDQFIRFIHAAQDARISSERLSEVHAERNEEAAGAFTAATTLPEDRTLTLAGVSFAYPGPQPEEVLHDISAVIPHGKITAIVGASGSGKTTLLKLLLKFYEPTRGDIRVGGARLRHLPAHFWRGRCGVVMQDGYLFTDTIARNIALGDEQVRVDELVRAVRIANLQEFIDTLPLGLNTKIGPEGQGLSQGQKQRILIARAVYRDPEYFFFDEATSALDACNERVIMENLNALFCGRTVMIIAHRLSTVQHADHLLVLDAGTVAEQGTHEELVAARGVYYTLVRNQLELGA
ncbi:peptidase domain-containing ABC transporter [bacterium]|nr:peptidase domain-containing ABC transporter [bacterium]